ncbi:uncharacterized protein zgc:171601 [Onychostoma macrolepis]|uniref:uncharacterized protein zgc:171601 n=1 Tax=Onychostoma macrolepis TaxID=369639 RepID=UPI00272D5280|nr:uncharacterized protein zgc:171601 [Onychostoma macrolepis]
MKNPGLLLCILLAKGVFGDIVKSVMEGDSVTLHTDLTDIQKYELILWTFGSDSTRIAQINNVVNKISIYNDVLDGKFRDRLQLDDQNGSLTITDTTTEDSGLYELQIIGGKEVPPKKFSIIVSASLPVPVISRNSSQCSSPSGSSASRCELLCSVVNVSHVTLSWYKGNSLLSSISVSDLSISLSLPLEVEYQDKNTYSCVLNNPISNQTQHLDISQLCQPCSVDESEDGLPFGRVVLICAVIVTVFVLAVVGMFSIYWKYRKTKQLGSPGDDLAETDELKTVSVRVGETVTLNTGVTAIQSFDVLQWRFGELYTDSTNPFTVIAKLNEQNNFDFICHDKTVRHRVKLDQQNGYLTISDIRSTDFGIYKLNISRNGKNMISKSFIVRDSSENGECARGGNIIDEWRDYRKHLCVFGDIVKSVMEGDSVTLSTDLTDMQKYERILWTFGSDSTRIVQINNVVNKLSLYEDVLDGKFRDRLKLDHHTGSLTITNMTYEHTGLYKLQFVGINEVPPKTFSIIVSALPVPVISRNSSQCSSPSGSSASRCELLCSVVNVSHVTLSWYKGNSLLSSISVSDLSISLSLPLEVEYQDKNTYSCVLNNPIRNQTTHLDISRLCHTCSVDESSLNPEDGLPFGHAVLICVAIVVTVFVLAVVGMFSIYWKYRKTNQLGQISRQESYEMSIGDSLAESDVMKSVSARVGESVTLNTGVTNIQSFDVLQWKFGTSNTHFTNPFSVIARLNEPNHSDSNGHKERFRDRLQLNQKTGYLTINHIRPTDFGIYKLNISRNGRIVMSKSFIVRDSSENKENVSEETKTQLLSEEIEANTCL